MTSLRILLALLLLQNIAMGQACVVNSTEPPPLYSAGTPVAWPKTNLYQAPTYAGHVEYYINCTYIVSPDGTYWSCPSPSLQNDISTAADNWNSAATSNGSTVNLRGVNVPPTSDGSCGPPPCFPTYTPWINITMRSQGNTSASFYDYGCMSPYCTYQTPSYYRLGFADINLSLSVTNDHYMKFLMAHEIGHTMALADCDMCNTDTTVMTSDSIDLNDPTIGLTAPGNCDNLQVMNTDVAFLLRPPLKSVSSTLLASGGRDTSRGIERVPDKEFLTEDAWTVAAK